MPECAFEQVVLCDRVDQPQCECLLRIHRLAVGHHLQGRTDADQTWRALCSASAGQKPQGNFRESETCCRFGDAPMARKGKFQAATKRQAVHCRHHRNGQLVEGREQLANGGGQLRIGIEVADVCAGGEEASVTNKDQCLGVAFGCHRVDLCRECLGQLAAECVHGRVREPQHDTRAALHPFNLHDQSRNWPVVTHQSVRDGLFATDYLPIEQVFY